jgi:hypothetical protein
MDHQHHPPPTHRDTGKCIWTHRRSEQPSPPLPPPVPVPCALPSSPLPICRRARGRSAGEERPRARFDSPRNNREETRGEEQRHAGQRRTREPSERGNGEERGGGRRRRGGKRDGTGKEREERRVKERHAAELGRGSHPGEDTCTQHRNTEIRVQAHGWVMFFPADSLPVLAWLER